MTKYRNKLPQRNEGFFLTDGGLETTLIFHEGLELPDFAAFHLLKDDAGYEALRNYYNTYVVLARDYEVGLVLESPTWRSNPDWGKRLGYSESELAAANRKAIELLVEIRNQYETDTTPMVISGCVGPRGDGYNPTTRMSAEEAQQYHAAQIGVFRDTGADMVTAITINYVEEAIGITQAAQAAGMPVAISFTVETDGNLPTGQTLKEAIESVDAATNHAPVYYMISCAHPTHFAEALNSNEPWVERIGGLRANASTRSHAELNDSAELDEGNPAELGRQHRELFTKLTNLRVLGGCCGTDHRHVEEICKATIATDKQGKRTLVVKTIDLPNRVSLNYAEQGDPSGLPVIFLHGVTDSWRSFEPVLPHLPDSIHAFAITQRGHDDLSHPAAGYRYHDFTVDVEAFMDALNLKAAVLVGHSLGSAVAQRFAIDYPERVLGLALVATFDNLTKNPEVQELYDSAIATLTEPVDEGIIREFQQSTLAQPVPPEFFEMVVEESKKVPARVWQATFAGFLAEDFSAERHKIKAPTLIIWGDHDTFCLRSDQDMLLATIADSQLVIYRGAGHALHWEQPEQFTADLLDFLESLNKLQRNELSPAA